MVYEVLKEERESARRGELLAILGARDSMLVRLQVDELDIRKLMVHLEGHSNLEVVVSREKAGVFKRWFEEAD